MALEYGAVECFLCDSGGSSQMIYNGDEPTRDIYYGEKVVFTGRMIPNVMALVKKQEDVPDTGDDENHMQNLINQIAELTAENDRLTKENQLLRVSKTELLNRIDEAMEVLEGKP